jgi:(4-(4-[2-(gamma-L-glutamylamino)ethyl]phenoxymethyl)furan-2-yl)methanamine synthase
MIGITGWDIGGANVKAACLYLGEGGDVQERVDSKPFEIWRDKDRLPDVLQSLFSSISPEASPAAMAVTMTAELSDVFVTKREGVLFVLESLRVCFPELPIYALNLSGEFVPLVEAQARPLDFAATNWRASAQWISHEFPNCLLVDVGSTTTDILPILDGRVSVSGHTDMARLTSGELVFTGALRTNLAAIVQSVPIAGKPCRVASEYFAVSGDVHLILGHLHSQEYTCGTPDGKSPSVESARRRLARLVCADTDVLSTEEIDELARYVCVQQISQIREGIEQVISRMPRLRNYPVVAFGTGSFLAADAARSLGLEVQDLSKNWGNGRSEAVPCLAAAYLLAEYLQAGSK